MELINIKLMSREQKIRLKLCGKYLLSNSKSDNFEKYRNKKKIIVALAADYGNLGDVAITYAQTKFLKDRFPTYEIIDFPISETFTEIKSLKKICTTEDIITLVGGGNTGDMYDDIEYCRQFLIQQFPKNKIIAFPQTIDFSDTDYGEKALQKAIKVYSKHRNLTLSAREEKSFKKYEELFKKNKVVFTPDIVLSLDESLPQYKREGITLCLRSDGEKFLDKVTELKFIEKLGENFDIFYQDTHIDKNRMSVQERIDELNKIWDVFKKSRLVITDRLHGMIFCAITKTPCIAIDNSNRKISGVYNGWLKDSNYIELMKEINIEELLKKADFMMAKDLSKLNTISVSQRFDILI